MSGSNGSNSNGDIQVGVQITGWLTKQGKEWKTWKKRYCRLNNFLEAPNTFYFSYFTNQDQSDLKGQINLNDVVAIIERDQTKNKANVFSISTRSRTYFFECSSLKEHDDWVSVLKKCWNRSQQAKNLSPNQTHPLQNQMAPNLLTIEIENKTNKTMQLVEQAINGTWYKPPEMFVQPYSSITLSTDKAGFIVYRFILPNENINLGFNAVKYSWSQPGYENKRTYVLDKKEGFENYFFEVIQSLSEQHSYIKWQNLEKFVQQMPPVPEVPSFTNFDQTKNNQPNESSGRRESFGETPPPASNQHELTPSEKAYLAEIQQEAEQSLPKVENHVGINNYYHIAQQFWEQAQVSKKAGDVESAYILFYKYSTFVVDRLPVHLSYNQSKFADDKAAARAKCKKIFSDLEVLQAKLLESKRNELTLESRLPSVPNNRSTTRK